MNTMRIGKKALKAYAKQAGQKMLSRMDDDSRERMMDMLPQSKSEAMEMLSHLKSKMLTPSDTSEGMMYLQKGKKELKEYAKQAGLEIIGKMDDTSRERVMGVLSQRQNDALDVLDCVKAKAQLPFQAPEKSKDKLEEIISSPVLTFLLAFSAINCTFLSVASVRSDAAVQSGAGFLHHQWLLILFFALMILGQAVYRMVKKAKKAPASQPLPQADAVLDTDQAKVLLQKQLSRLITDSEAVCGMLRQEQLEGRTMYEDDLVKLYASLCETKADRPDCEEINYSLTVAEMMLRQLGLKPLPYSEERKKLFTVEVEDYHNEMRCPAIIREKTGELVKKGEYIQNIHELKELSRKNP